MSEGETPAGAAQQSLTPPRQALQLAVSTLLMCPTSYQSELVSLSLIAALSEQSNSLLKLMFCSVLRQVSNLRSSSSSGLTPRSAKGSPALGKSASVSTPRSRTRTPVSSFDMLFYRMPQTHVHSFVPGSKYCVVRQICVAQQTCTLRGR